MTTHIILVTLEGLAGIVLAYGYVRLLTSKDFYKARRFIESLQSKIKEQQEGGERAYRWQRATENVVTNLMRQLREHRGESGLPDIDAEIREEQERLEKQSKPFHDHPNRWKMPNC